MDSLHQRRHSTERRLSALESARQVLHSVADGNRDPYEAYRQLYAIYTGTSGLLEELKPLFRLPGICADGPITANDEFRRTVVSAAVNWLHEYPKE
jgi:hypothetical protein